MTIQTNNFARALNSGQLLVTAECLPPRGADAAYIIDFSSKLPPNLDAVVVADSPDAIRSSSISTASILKVIRTHGNAIAAQQSRIDKRIAKNSLS